ncbi:MAG: fructose-6-phosphate aldolase [Treponema sp.]|jgi:TalC/MipB family fructose-6-phosphate aldolase|nr:fructose-6-phosphate aldolase [Treponema sp.]
MMEFMLDTANLDAVSRCVDIFPICGVTGNPSILKAEGKIDFFSHLKKLRQIIGRERSLHVQVVAGDFQGIIKEAETILRKIDDRVFIKIPVTEEGLKAAGCLHDRGVRVTATAIYTQAQALMAAARGADYLALYCNRMKNMDIDADLSVKTLRAVFDREGMASKILAASFKGIGQVSAAIAAGAHGVTVSPSLLHDALGLPVIQAAVNDFYRDWTAVQGDVSIADL